jgi:hypothetical protein
MGCDSQFDRWTTDPNYGFLRPQVGRIIEVPEGVELKDFQKKQEIIGEGGAPMRATTFPSDVQGRKNHPVASGVLDYFPDALVAISHVSWLGNEQHNPGQSLRWDRSKSKDEADALLRHFLERGTIDSDGVRHSAKMAWRALALLQKEIEADK